MVLTGKKYYFFFLILFGSWNLSAQQLNFPLNRYMNIEFDRFLTLDTNIVMHTAMKPQKEHDTINYAFFIRLSSTFGQKHFAQWFADRTWIKRKLRYESFFGVRDKNFLLEINPVFNFELGRDVGRNDAINMYKNTRGFSVNGHITDKVSFSSSFYENQMQVQTYLMEYAGKIGVESYSPVTGGYKLNPGYGNFFGQGRTKPFKSTGVDFAMASGYVSYSPVKTFNIQFGHDKLFIGNGYRSMLLSDNSFNFPFLKLTKTFWENKIQYTAIYASMNSLRRVRLFTTPEAMFQRKAASFHYVSFIPNQRHEIGLFESTIWQNMKNDATVPLDLQFINPVILANTARFGFDSTINNMIGINYKYQPFKKIYFYTQLVLDGFSPFKFATQAGVRWFDVFGNPYWSVQAEYNYATTYTYMHRTTLQNYGHYNLPLAHPWGAGFNEWVGFINWHRSDFFFETRFSYGNFKLQNSKPFGKDIYLSINGPEYPEVVFSQIVYVDIKGGYVINPITNLRLMAGLTNYYRFDDKDRYNSNYLYLGISTSLTNLYLDI